jgi:sodium-coupled neutral amino acid transporter 9
MPQHVIPEGLLVLGSGKGGKQSSLVTVLSLWNTMMGTSILTMPWALGQAGFVAGILIIVAMMGATCWTCQIVVRYGEGGTMKGQPVEFADVVREYLGVRAYYLAVVVSIFTLVGALIVYVSPV